MKSFKFAVGKPYVVHIMRFRPDVKKLPPKTFWIPCNAEPSPESFQ